MNIFEAMKLIGRHNVVEGFWRTFFMGMGLIGMVAFLFIAAFVREMPFNWFTVSLMLLFAVMATLPMYLPRKTS